MKPASAVPIDWAEIRAYAERFEELKIIDSIEPAASGELIGLDPGRARSQLARFGPLSVGDALAPGASIRAISCTDQKLRVDVALGAETLVTFDVALADADEGPFRAAPLTLTYRSTDISFALLEPGGLGLRAALLGALEAGAWDTWCAARRGGRAQRAPDAERLEVRADGKIYLRITEACQERCTFCFFYDTDEVDNLVRHQDLSDVIAAIDPEGVTQVVLTGGEPTLDPRLPEYVAQLSERGFERIILQTNGILLAEPGRLEALAPHAERLGIGFSLHSASAEVNDAITTVERGFFDKKLSAITRAAELGFRFKITLVLSRLNLQELEDFVDLVADRIGDADAFVQLSLPSFHGRMLRFLDTYPRLSELAEAVPPALARADARGLRVSFCHQCQIPPCVLPRHTKHLESMWFCETPEMWQRDRAYGEGCDGCALRARCSGIWSGYAERFGTHELRPFPASEISPEVR